MKIIFIALALLLSSLSNAAESKYVDNPTGIYPSFEQVLDRYVEKSHSTLPYFNKEFESKGARTFYVVTKFYQGESFEQIYVKLEKITQSAYFGSIASTPAGGVDFKAGDKIEVAIKDLVDWLIVNEDGTEEGNLQGKALDLARSGRAAFLLKMSPKDGVFSSFEVVSVLNPHTKQEVIDIVPQNALDMVKRSLMESHGGKPSEDGKEKYTYIFVRFPNWKVIEYSKK